MTPSCESLREDRSETPGSFWFWSWFCSVNAADIIQTDYQTETLLCWGFVLIFLLSFFFPVEGNWELKVILQLRIICLPLSLMPAGFFIVYLNSTSSWYPSLYINTFSLSQFHPEYLLQFVPRGLAPVYRQLEGKDALARQANNSVRREKHTCFETLWKTWESNMVF